MVGIRLIVSMVAFLTNRSTNLGSAKAVEDRWHYLKLCVGDYLSKCRKASV